MKAALLYDGYCNFCVTIVRILELLNFESSSGRSLISLIPFQSAQLFREKYSLTTKELTSQIHLITAKGTVLKGNEAILQLGNYIPGLKPFTLIFKTQLGKVIYEVISRHRLKIMGCSKSCYISSKAGQ